MLGNLEGKSVETFMQLDGGIVAEQNESKLFRIDSFSPAGSAYRQAHMYITRASRRDGTPSEARARSVQVEAVE